MYIISNISIQVKLQDITEIKIINNVLNPDEMSICEHNNKTLTET